MHVLTVLGTRPEIIRLSRVIDQLDRVAKHTILFTGQNHDPRLSDIFFDELGVRTPDIHLGIRESTVMGQIGAILRGVERSIQTHAPDRMLVLGDTNSGIATVAAARMGIPTYHMEAGNRCYDDRVPEEINRRIIDHSSNILMPYTQRSKDNLVREGIDRTRILVTGNPILEVLNHYASRITDSDVANRLGVEEDGFMVSTLHRAENVDEPQRLAGLLKGLHAVSVDHGVPVLLPVHPRTADKIRQNGTDVDEKHVRLIPPLGFFDFVWLEKHARLVLTDSGTVQEECCIFQIPNITLRDVTERPETLECGSNILSGADPDQIRRSAKIALQRAGSWTPPAEYMEPHVSSTVVGILSGYRQAARPGFQDVSQTKVA